MNDIRKSGAKPVQSVQRALRLLDMFAPYRTHEGQHRTRWSVSDLARATGLHKSVVARLMATMNGSGYVVQDPVTKTYGVGPQSFAVGNAYEPFAILNSVACPAMERLTAQCGHASYLGVPSGNHYVILIAVESRSSIRVSIKVGEQRPYHSGAIGKVLLASLPDERIREILGTDPLQQLTPYTIDSVNEVLHQVAELRVSGVAFNNQESILGAGSVAAGVHNLKGECIGGLVVVYPTHVVSVEEIEHLAGMVWQTAEEISAGLRSFSLPTD